LILTDPSAASSSGAWISDEAGDCHAAGEEDAADDEDGEDVAGDALVEPDFFLGK
jgi:hypothetical protein